MELQEPILLKLPRFISVLCPFIKLWWPEWVLPTNVILKKQKEDWEEEFETEIRAYELLRPLQGTVIPHFYGQATYDATPTLVLSNMAGTNLYDLACKNFPEKEDEVLHKSLRDAFQALTSYGVEYQDQRLDNCLWVDGRVVMIDLEYVGFEMWENNCNAATANSLMSEFKRVRAAPPWWATEICERVGTSP